MDLTQSLLLIAALIAPSAFVISLVLVFADLFPKRLGMNDPERLAVPLVGPMQLLITAFKPLVWLFPSAPTA